MADQRTNDKTLWQGLVLATLLLATSQVQANFSLPQGQWFDQQRDGHGIDLQPIGPDHYILIIYTYTDTGEPVWYLADARVNGDLLSGDFGEFVYHESANPPQQLNHVVGSFSMQQGALGDCADRPASAATFSWTINDESASWCLKSLLNRNKPADQDFTAMWFAGEQDTGWGISLGMQGQGANEVWVVLVFYYDAAGQPRWAQAVGAPRSDPIALNNYRGYCRSCQATPIEVNPAGQILLDLGLERGWPSGIVDMQLDYALGQGQWNRPNTPVSALTDPLADLIPLPDTLPAAEAIAFLDVDLIPMTSDTPEVVPRQTVIVRNGVIEQVGGYREFPVPSDAWRIYAPGSFLGPGLTEMHLHVTVGGLNAARDAGTALLANGVTSVLNAGDGMTIDLADMRNRFNDDRWFGPAFYLANTAFGPGDNGPPSQTPTSPAQATAFANQLQLARYDFLKVYWQVLPSVFAQLAIESVVREMPLIGHIPQTQAMITSLEGGQILAVHVQEPFYSYMQGQMNPALIAGAAQIFLDNGTYMSPTLAVFESYFGVFGGDQQAFDEFTNREGVRYTHPNVRQSWVNYFNGSGIQGNGQVIGGLDAMQELFWQIARDFHQAGIPMLVGTDAPGFPGVMSGFGVHEELRLLTEVGLSDAEAYAAGSRNAGLFLDDTLAVEPGIGIVQAGRRADLILVRDNPLTDVAVLRHPSGVMSRGRWWSEVFLDEALEVMANRYQTSKSGVISDAEIGPLYCTDHLAWWNYQSH